MAFIGLLCLKYLPELGWKPIILTVKNGEYPTLDESLMSEVNNECEIFKTKSWEPNRLYKKFLKKDPNAPLPIAAVAKSDGSWKQKLSRWIRLNLFIPDAKIGWKYYAVKEGKKIIDKYKPDLILSSSPPPTVHLIAQKLSKKYKIPWIADFRDPWTNIYHYDNVKFFPLSKYFNKKLENSVVKNCSAAVTVSNCLPEIIGEEKYRDKFSVIPNGYDFDIIPHISSQKKEKIVILHTGKLVDTQNPVSLWRALEKIIRHNPKIKEKLI